MVMKIEVGENLMRSWLRHVKGCQLAELNWKPSSTWEKYGNAQDLMDQARAFFLRALEIEVFKKTTKASQVIKQAEIDVLGVKLGLNGCVEVVYGADIAYHEAGLHYEDNLGRILKKLLRGRLAIECYFGPVPCQMVFASPIVGSKSMPELLNAIERLRAFFIICGLDTITCFYANEQFKKEILIPTLDSSTDTADSSELFLRSYRLASRFALLHRKDLSDPQSPSGEPETSGSDTVLRKRRQAPTISPDEGPAELGKIIRWANNPSLKVHRIIVFWSVTDRSHTTGS
jgi:hypothetical protein